MADQHSSHQHHRNSAMSTAAIARINARRRGYRRRPGGDDSNPNLQPDPIVGGGVPDLSGAAYVPPSLDSMLSPSNNLAATSPHSTQTGHASHTETIGATAHDDYVTQPPRISKSTSLTGKISTLFRSRPPKSPSGRQGSRSGDSSNRRPSHHNPYSSSSGDEGDHTGRTMSHQGDDDDAQDEADEFQDDASGANSHGTGLVSVRSYNSQRLFYSSHNDDDSDDSYESRLSRLSNLSRQRDRADGVANRNRRGRPTTTARSIPTHRQIHSMSTNTTNATSMTSMDTDDDQSHTTGGSVTTGTRSTATGMGGGDGGSRKTILRYRGFSTSIQSLFLDEALVCAAMGCFGLILSNRTEHLLQLRNQRRGGNLSPNRRGRDTAAAMSSRLPSRVVAYGLILTVALMFVTFLIWGFGTGSQGLATGFNNDGYDYYDNSRNDDNAVDDYAAQDDYNNAQQVDDGYYQQQQDDDDDYAAAANDDYQQNGDGGNGDDGNYNYYQNDDGDDAAVADDGANNDDGAVQGDDAGGNNDDAGDDGNRDDAYDDYYRGRRALARPAEHPSRRKHSLKGIFSLRDVHEQIWQNPLWDTLALQLNGTMEAIAGDLDGDYGGAAAGQYRRRGEEYADDGVTSVDDYIASDAYAAQQQTQAVGAHVRTGLFFLFLLFLGILGRRRRMRTRFFLVKARAQEDHLYYASSEIGASRRVNFQDTREDQYEGACSHTLCGCYPVDDVAPNYEQENAPQMQVTDKGIFRRKRRRFHQDIVARAFSCFMHSCCGALCKCWFQCLSICALAQEAREIRLLVPPRFQRIDFITHQPFSEYQSQVIDLRKEWMGLDSDGNGGLMRHYKALSRLSRYIVVIGSVSILAIVVTLQLNPRAAFSLEDVIVLIATFVQSFLVLFIVHWIFHKSDLSLDAVIKLFAAGFIIAVPTAFFFEGLLVNIVLFGAWGVYEVFAAILGDGFATWVFEHWRAVWILGELFNAYIVAAVTEELCKYYTFRAVEHPDLVFLTGLDNMEAHSEIAVEGGLVKYPFGSHQVESRIRDREGDDYSHKSHRSSRSRESSQNRSRSSSRDKRLLEEGEDENEVQPDVRSYRQRAMAITTGMISVAIGLACAENFLYVFVLGGALGNEAADEDSHKGDAMEAWIVLFFRSIFPVHALCAALQSIHMIQKFVETTDTVSGHRIGVGRIVLPAVLLHGSFDAILMGINVYVETAWDNYLAEHEGNLDNVDEDPPYDSLAVNMVAWISITVIMILGLSWYYFENRRQRLRLIALEMEDKMFDSQSQVPTPGSRTTGRSPTRRRRSGSSRSSRRQQKAQQAASKQPAQQKEIELV